MTGSLMSMENERRASAVIHFRRERNDAPLIKATDHSAVCGVAGLPGSL